MQDLNDVSGKIPGWMYKWYFPYLNLNWSSNKLTVVLPKGDVSLYFLCALHIVIAIKEL